MNPATTATGGTADRLYTAADLEAARAEGRREANDAIHWETSCVGCAGRYTDLARERAEGGQETAALIAAQLRALYDQVGDRALLEAVAVALRHAGTYGQTLPDGTIRP